VPELELCSRCGKKVLIARYSWSQKQTICKICAEADIQSLSIPIDNKPFQRLENSASEGNHDLIIGKSGKPFQYNPNSNKEPILITWPTLLKTSIGLSLLVILVLSGFLGWRNINEDLTDDSALPVKINSPKN